MLKSTECKKEKRLKLGKIALKNNKAQLMNFSSINKQSNKKL